MVSSVNPVLPNKHDSISIQALIRQNAVEQNQVLKDLTLWEDGIKQSDAKLTRTGHDYESTTILNHHDNGDTRNDHGSDIATESTITYTSTIQETKANCNSSTTQRSSPEATEEKERARGNILYSKKLYKEAVKCYTNCIRMNPKSAAAYSNRAMVYLKLKEWQKAENDASTALRIDPLHNKSYQRRSAARSSLGKIRASIKDLHLAKTTATDDKLANEMNGKCSKAISILEGLIKRAPRRKIPIKFIPSVHKRRSDTGEGQERTRRDNSAVLAKNGACDLTSTSGYQPTRSHSQSSPLKPNKLNVSMDVLQKARTWCSFEQTWYSLSESDKTECLKKVQPQTITNIYKNGMENSDILLDILHHCAKMKNENVEKQCLLNPSVMILRTVSKIPAIDLAVMMMNSSQKSKLCGYIEEVTDSLSREECAKFKKKFGLK